MIARALFVSVATGFLVVACGGTVLGGDDGGTGGAGGHPGSDAGSTYCPSTLPPQGTACSDEGLYCEYGDDPNLNCDTITQCYGGQWNVEKGYGGTCPTPPANPSGCPDSFASVPVGQHCGTLVGTTCSYPQGFCGCSIGSGGPYPEDAAAVATWICDAPATGCPMPRPKLGTPCSQDNLECDYSPCSLPSGVSLICQSGAWQDAPYGCAL
jgi:hypothetical protein